ncbi:hypothetical protein L202_01558 [Cryptococcus amylolentus CBS 6039]|uniref:Uncharacterized protein n=1 Tax=Cryptococcus amylolentus CBS 6039 TaxID=1295533 RepID=A0A1E3I6F8_9TREE|nr:hypothetical protein L202_01558 [Cryptococcus amylolentus CBS 6039]ODN83416.1 hypothetical protein L202_01558 [Cryptococcus amylolentus CBS 6039]
MDSLPIAFGKQNQQPSTSTKAKKPRPKKANGGPSHLSHPQLPPKPPQSAQGRGSNQTELGRRGAAGSSWIAGAEKRKEEANGGAASSKRPRQSNGAGAGRYDAGPKGNHSRRGQNIRYLLAEHMFEDPWARLPFKQSR